MSLRLFDEPWLMRLIGWFVFRPSERGVGGWRRGMGLTVAGREAMAEGPTALIVV